MQLTSLSLALTRAGFLSFSPASLFANGEVGAWFDPSDFGTMWQDSAGTTPVTAVEQPVGLMLDKRLGLVLGSDQLSTGVPALVGTANAATYNTTTGVGSVTRIDSSNQSFIQWSGLSANSFYRINISCQTNAIIVRTGTQAGTSVQTVSAGQSLSVLVPSDSSGRIAITNTTAASTSTFTVSSVRELPGNHATQSTSASRPVLSARVNVLEQTQAFDNAYWTKGLAEVTANAATAPNGTVTADKLICNSGVSSGSIYAIPPTIATPVQSVIYAKSAEWSWLKIELRQGSNLRYVWFDLINGVVGTKNAGLEASIVLENGGWWRCVCTGPGIDTRYRISPTNGDGVDSIGDGTSGIYIWGADLRVANDGVGLPAYQRVNTSTDYDTTGFPMYLRFDGVDDGMVTNSINFTSTDKMTVWAGVRKLSDATAGLVAELSASVTANNGTFGVLAPQSTNPNYSFATNVGAFTQRLATTFVAPLSNVLSCAFNLSVSGNGQTSPRVNATVPTLGNAAATGPGNFGNYPLYIGRRGGTSLAFNGRFYSLIVRGAQSTAEQIAATETYVNSKTKAFA